MRHADYGRAIFAGLAGGQAEFKLWPPFGKDGHSLFTRGNKVWKPIVAEFLEKHGFPATRPSMQEQVSMKVE
ncbi:hypothetical protein [Undibacterium sp.]|jgi:hypothetical protein|uniref:hypothetical protein n=1 Tax=Undibacterium sp. TaxID=1914977 RepID=UPI002BAB234E|nr:hypothetical protein [Undibacterium sp.]HTD04377.1 hypothetical protein [Undibacterium sp.]